MDDDFLARQQALQRSLDETSAAFDRYFSQQEQPILTTSHGLSEDGRESASTPEAAPEPEPEPQAVAQPSAQPQPASPHARTKWIPASLMETRPVAVTPPRPRARPGSASEAALLISPATYRTHSAHEGFAESKRSPGRSLHHSPEQKHSTHDGSERLSRSSPSRTPRHSPKRSRGPLATDHHIPSAIIGNGNPLVEERLFGNGVDFAWASSLRSSGPTRHQFSQSKSEARATKTVSPAQRPGSTTHSTPSPSSRVVSPRSRPGRHQFTRDLSIAKGTQPSTGRSATIGDGTTLVHGSMFSDAAQHTWASSLRSSGGRSPRSRHTPSSSRSKEVMETLDVFAGRGEGDAMPSIDHDRVPSLPPGWTVHTSSKSGEEYYHNIYTGSSQWDWPTHEPLPYGWEAAVSKRTGAIYYIDVARNVAQYEHPSTARVAQEALLQTHKADLIRQAAKLVAENGESFVQVLLEQGSEFSFLQSTAPDDPAALEYEYYTKCLRHELEHKVASSSSTERRDGGVESRRTTRSSSTGANESKPWREEDSVVDAIETLASSAAEALSTHGRFGCTHGYLNQSPGVELQRGARTPRRRELAPTAGQRQRQQATNTTA